MHKNGMGYPCLSPEQLELLMGEGVKEKEILPADINMQKDVLLQDFDISEDKKITGKEQDFDFFAPPLQGKNIVQHFEAIAKEMFAPWKRGLNQLVRRSPAEAPTRYCLQAGWTRYEPGEDPVAVPYPDDAGLVFDTETFVRADRFAYPIIATAASHEAIYIWLHESLVDAAVDYKPQLVPLGDSTHKLLIMHNSAYDLCRIQERYTFGQTKIASLDTMSIQRVIAGFSDAHKWVVASNKPPDDDNQKAYWYKMRKHGSRMSLVASYEYMTGEKLPAEAKEIRQLFVKANDLSEVRDHIDAALDYAVRDVILTYTLFRRQWITFRKYVPSWVPIWGQIQLANSIVPVEEDWYLWHRKCEGEYQRLTLEIEKLLGDLADDTFRRWQQGELDVNSDAWLKHLDWSVPLSDTHPLAGIPKWYQNRVKNGVPLRLSPRNELSHYLLQVNWLGKPLVIGSIWNKDSEKMEKSWGTYAEDGSFERMPHYKTPGANVGIVLSEKYLHHFDAGRLTSDFPKAREIIEKASQISYWISKRGLVLSRPAVITPTYDHKPWLALAPQVTPYNTMSHRTGSPLFLTLAAHLGEDKIGAEIKSKIKAPPGYKIVGFDSKSLLK